MAVVITQTLDTRDNTNHSLTSHQARGLKIEAGTLTTDGGTYVTGGMSFTAKSIPADRLLGMILLPAGANEGQRVYSYDYTNEKIQVFESGTASASLDELDNGADTVSATIRYIAIGY